MRSFVVMLFLAGTLAPPQPVAAEITCFTHVTTDPDFQPTHASSHVILVRGELTARDIRRVVRRHTSELRGCYEREVDGLDVVVEGRVELRFVVDEASGEVVDAEIASSPFDDAAFSACLVQAIETWHFPAVLNGEALVKITYPIRFARADS